MFSSKRFTLTYTFSDEIMYHAKLHPEQYSDTFSAAQLKTLYNSIRYVCQTAVDLLADSHQFPDEWLFNHRWGKGKKDAPTKLPNGAAITFLTVGGRTSCVVPSVQKKTGPVTADIEGGETTTKAGSKAKTKIKTKSRKRKQESESKSEELSELTSSEEMSAAEPAPEPIERKARTPKVKESSVIKEEADKEVQTKSPSKKRARTRKPSAKVAQDDTQEIPKDEEMEAKTSAVAVKPRFNGKQKSKTSELSVNAEELSLSNEPAAKKAKKSAALKQATEEVIGGRRRSGRAVKA